MAVTKTHPIKSTLKAAIDYILNPEKTDGKLLASSFGLSLIHISAVMVDNLRRLLLGINLSDKAIMLSLIHISYRLLKNGTIKSFVVGRRYRIPKICIFEYLAIIDKSPA